MNTKEGEVGRGGSKGGEEGGEGSGDHTFILMSSLLLPDSKREAWRCRINPSPSSVITPCKSLFKSSLFSASNLTATT